jgi:hypothetical protein
VGDTLFVEEGAVSTGWTRELSWSIVLHDVSHARGAWVILQAARVHRADLVWISINGELTVGALATSGESGPRALSHSVPLWGLREGTNSFVGRLGSLSYRTEKLPSLVSCRVVLLP